MVICDDCKLKDAGCVLKDLVLASNGTSCQFYSAQVMEKLAQNEEFTVSWPATNNRRITQIVKGGQIISQEESHVENHF